MRTRSGLTIPQFGGWSARWPTSAASSASVACAKAASTPSPVRVTIVPALKSPIAAMAEAAMQQDHGRAGPIRGVPEPSTVVFDIALISCDRQRCGALRFKPAEVVVVRFHVALLVWL